MGKIKRFLSKWIKSDDNVGLYGVRPTSPVMYHSEEYLWGQHEDPKGLRILRPNHAGVLLVTGDERPINYGAIRVDNRSLVYWTSQGLQEIWKCYDGVTLECPLIKRFESGDEGDLIAKGYIAVVPLERIVRVIF